MADNQKIKMQIERGNVNVENKEHFLEEDFERPATPDRQRRYERFGDTLEKQADAVVEKAGEGDDIISRGAYNQQQAARTKEIEKVLEKDLGDIYVSLPPEKQRQFRIVGEQTAMAINDLIKTGKLKLKKIIELIRKWLTIIPGVNRFFLEQEAKIKADEIMRINKKQL